MYIQLTIVISIYITKYIYTAIYMLAIYMRMNGRLANSTIIYSYIVKNIGIAIMALF